MARMMGMLSAAALGLALLSGGARADTGEAAQARAMLDKVVAGVTTDEHATLAEIVKGANGFRKGDLYAFCANAGNGAVVAHPFRLGDNLADQADKNGVLFGVQMLKTAQLGTVSEVHYMWPKPGTTTPVEKSTFYTKVDDLVCAVGYYAK
jgi:signal transduction histidine kinase